MKNVDKYSRNYFAPEQTEYQWMHREYVDTAPRWCSVDLRDGNQSLVVPMDLEKKNRIRRKMIEQCSSSIIVFGYGKKDSGTYQEYHIAKDDN